MSDPMGDCDRTVQQLADYRTDVLSPRRRAAVEAHLAGCAECAAELKRLDAVLTLVDRNTEMQEPPAGLWNGVYNRITAPTARPPIGAVLRGWLVRPAGVAGVGLAALALVLGLVFGGGGHDEMAPTEMAAASDYVQGHALYAGQAPFADRVSYLTVVAAQPPIPKRQSR